MNCTFIAVANTNARIMWAMLRGEAELQLWTDVAGDFET